jgi:hypothetical protein
MRRLIFAILMICVPSGVFAQPPMQFRAFPPDRWYEALMGAHGWTIYASGTIDADADQRLDQIIQQSKIPFGSYIYLHSPGGDVLGGMKLGKVIRKYLLVTDVGQLDPNNTRTIESKPGECYSACAMAFLGGEYRFLKDGSVYGVHRFSWLTPTAHDADLAQMMSAVEVEYIRSMGVSTDLFTLKSQVGGDEIIAPPRDQLVALNVLNNGVKYVKRTIESVPEALYLKGERDTSFGINKFLIMCPAQGTMALYIIFDVGQNGDEVMRFNVDNLMIDGNKISLGERRIGKQILNGWINLIYSINRPMLDAITKANTVGIALQPTNEAAFFAGFDGMPFEEGKKKLPGFLQACKASLSAR